MGSAVNGSMDVQVVEYVWVFADGGAACVLCIVCVCLGVRQLE